VIVSGRGQRGTSLVKKPVPEFKRSFSMTENERSGLVFAKNGSVNSGTVKSRT
jgi:hypothetical protein